MPPDLSPHLVSRALASFSELSDEDRAELVPLGRPYHYEPGELIVTTAEAGEALFVVVSGEVRVVGAGREGADILRRPGQMFGEMALFYGERRQGERRAPEVIATEPAVCVAIPRAVLDARLAERPHLASFLSEVLKRRFDDPEIPHTVGKYHILGELGRGGMSIVYEAIHSGLSRTVAIKMLSHSLAFDQRFAARFHKEATIIAALDHPGIVRVYDVEEAYRTTFIIMEKIDGNTLDGVVGRHGRLPIRRARVILQKVARALDFAHSRGVIHRDIKPGNVAVNSEGAVKLMDFGVAMTSGDPDEEYVPGTPAYIAPEVAQGQRADARSDIYSLGVMAFELLTGQLPFDIKPGQLSVLAEARALVRMHVEETLPSPRVFRPDLPDDLNHLISRATSKRPEERFGSCREIVELLEGVTGQADLDQVGVKTITLLHGPAQEREVRALLDSFIQSASIIPGVRIVRQG